MKKTSQQSSLLEHYFYGFIALLKKYSHSQFYGGETTRHSTFWRASVWQIYVRNIAYCLCTSASAASYYFYRPFLRCAMKRMRIASLNMSLTKMVLVKTKPLSIIRNAVKFTQQTVVNSIFPCDRIVNHSSPVASLPPTGSISFWEDFHHGYAFQ